MASRVDLVCGKSAFRPKVKGELIEEEEASAARQPVVQNHHIGASRLFGGGILQALDRVGISFDVLFSDLLSRTGHLPLM